MAFCRHLFGHKLARSRSRGQGASEYLVVLAAVMLIALAAISLLSSIYPAAGGAAEAESTAYWSSQASPFQMLEAQFGGGLSCTDLSSNSTGYKLLVRSADSSTLVLKGVTTDGVSRTFCLAGGQSGSPIAFAGYQRRTINVLTGANCTNGSLIGASLSFAYDRPPFTGRVQNGAKKLLSRCAGAALVSSAGEGGIESGSQLFILVGSQLPPGTVGQAYSATLAASGGNGSYSWSGSGLPLGLSIGSATGVISGTPANGSAGNYTVAVSVQAGSASGSASLSLAISAASGPSALSVTTASLPDTAEGSFYSTLLSAAGGTPPYSWSGSGLPTGLAISPSGAIFGTPPAGSAGNYTVHAVVADSASRAASSDPDLSLRVGPSGLPLQITTASPLPSGTAGTAYGPVQLSASGGTGTGYAWSNATPLPSGFSLNLTGYLAGTSPSVGTYVFGIRVQDSGSNSAAKNFTVRTGLSCGPPCCHDSEVCFFTSECCGSMACIAGICANCKVQGQSCSADYECCSEAQYCIGGVCSK